MAKKYVGKLKGLPIVEGNPNELKKNELLLEQGSLNKREGKEVKPIGTSTGGESGLLYFKLAAGEAQIKGYWCDETSGGFGSKIEAVMTTIGGDSYIENLQFWLYYNVVCTCLNAKRTGIMTVPLYLSMQNNNIAFTLAMPSDPNYCRIYSPSYSPPYYDAGRFIEAFKNSPDFIAITKEEHDAIFDSIVEYIKTESSE